MVVTPKSRESGNEGFLGDVEGLVRIAD